MTEPTLTGPTTVVPTLTGQTVAIVGASSGIGLATAKAAALAGARVVMLSRSQKKLDEAAKAVTGTVQAIAMNMLDRAAVDRAIASIGPIDHLVLTAVADELTRLARITAITDEQVERGFDKLRGFVHVTRAAVPLLRERGSIAMMTGASAVKPSAGFSILAAESASIVSFGKALALELAPTRVNVLMAGVVDTPIHAERREQMKAWAESADLPARRFGQPEDIAHGILFLLTNPYVTGHTLVIDGGLVAS